MMSSSDWASLILAGGLVGLTIVGELKDIELCNLSLHKASDPGLRWRIALHLLSGARHWFFLPALATTMPTLVLWRGSDAMSICMNTVAMMFLAEIDNVLCELPTSQPATAA